MKLTPQQAWDQLSAGNQRFAADNTYHPRLDSVRRSELTDGQNPIALVFSCSDSRAPVELIFDAGLGDIFVVRTAGQILGESVLGSVSYAVNSLQVPLVIVLGHESCGAVGAAVDALDQGEVPTDHRRVLVERVTPSVLAARSKGKSTAADFERFHAAEIAFQLTGRLSTLKPAINDGRCAVIAAHYELDSGLVEVVNAFGDVQI